MSKLKAVWNCQRCAAAVATLCVGWASGNALGPVYSKETPGNGSALRTYAVTRSEVARARLANNRILLDLSDRTAYLYSGSDLIGSYPVAIGTAKTPTPIGEFAVTQLVVNPVWQSPWTGEVRSPGPNSALGSRWIGFTHNSEGVFGFHGTPTVESIGHAASNGCVRMRNADVVELFNQVAVGTTVSVVP